jgi:hypothetical protein
MLYASETTRAQASPSERENMAYVPQALPTYQHMKDMVGNGTHRGQGAEC